MPSEYPIIAPYSMQPINEFPMNVPCPTCKQIVSTNVEFGAGTMTYLISVVMIVFGFVCCSCIPCCVDACKVGSIG
ncbi:hypothetical protein L596_030360 [Steinernema carpocapsae]|uniref:LITAF domain-containing protein n=1 Tax=Steinernema carpocapsae TaxID=34508 RepID=A0A4U5LP74_STECR|nr:hypothetical protein L596_030360 [Steinernema carpocapsae]